MVSGAEQRSAGHKKRRQKTRDTHNTQKSKTFYILVSSGRQRLCVLCCVLPGSVLDAACCAVCCGSRYQE